MSDIFEQAKQIAIDHMNKFDEITRLQEIVVYYIWYLYNRMNEKRFIEFYGENASKEYIAEKWAAFKRNNNAWFMDLDNNHRQRLVNDAVSYYTKEEND